MEQLLFVRKSLPSNGEAEGRGSKRQDGKFSLHRNVAEKVEGKESIGAQPLEMDSTLCLSKTYSLSHLPEKGSTNSMQLVP